MANERDKLVAQVSPESSVNDEIQAAPKTSRILDSAKPDPETERNDEKCADTKSEDKDGTSYINSTSLFYIRGDNYVSDI